MTQMHFNNQSREFGKWCPLIERVISFNRCIGIGFIFGLEPNCLHIEVMKLCELCGFRFFNWQLRRGLAENHFKMVRATKYAVVDSKFIARTFAALLPRYSW